MEEDNKLFWMVIVHKVHVNTVLPHLFKDSVVLRGCDVVRKRQRERGSERDQLRQRDRKRGTDRGRERERERERERVRDED